MARIPLVEGNRSMREFLLSELELSSHDVTAEPDELATLNAIHERLPFVDCRYPDAGNRRH